MLSILFLSFFVISSFRLVSCRHVKFEMMTEEQFQSLNLQETNGIEDGSTHENDDETTSNTSSAPPVRRSRFFRSKRKQRVNEEQSAEVDSNSDASNQPTNSSESPSETIIKCPMKNYIFLISRTSY